MSIIITRHEALINVLKDMFNLGDDVRVIAHASREDIKGKHVYGVLPLHLAKYAKCVTTINLNIPQELRGVELTEAQVREYMDEPETFKVFNQADIGELSWTLFDTEMFAKGVANNMREITGYDEDEESYTLVEEHMTSYTTSTIDKYIANSAYWRHKLNSF